MKEKVKDSSMQKRLLSVKETATYLGINHGTLYNRIHRKTAKPFPIKPRRIGRRVLFDIRDIDAYIESL